MRAFIVSAIAALLVTATGVAGTKGGTVLPIAGGTFEASGAVHVGNGVLFVDDGRARELLWMALDGEGRQVGEAQPIALGVAVPDMEGITTDGTFIYVVGSQSKKESARGAGLARLTFDPAAQRVSDVRAVDGLKELVFDALPHVQRAAGRKVDGFNIEGLAWDPSRQRLLLGLRAPVRDGQAMIIPLRVGATFDRKSIQVMADEVVALPMAGGIRSLEYDPASKTFQIISGADGKGSFAFWRWSGAGAPIREEVTAQIVDASLKPEGVTRVRTPHASYTLVVFDTSRYIALRDSN